MSVQRLHHKRATLQLGHVRKFVSGGTRTIRGIATRGDLDRVGEIVEPTGGIWRLPLPLLFGHNHAEVIGVVREARASAAGVEVVAEIAEGVARADEVWKLIELGGLDSFSIGFRGLESEPIPSGRRWTKWELLELSVVAVPALPSAKIRRGLKHTDGSVPLINLHGAVKLRRAS